MVRLAEANGWHWASPSVRRWMEQSRSAFEAYFEGAARPYLDFGDEISIGPLSGGSNSLFTRIFSGLEISRLSDNGEFSQSTEILKFQMRESLLAWNSQIRRSGVPRFGTVGENINEWIQDCRPPEGELQKLAEAARDTRIQLSSPSVRLAAAFIEMQHLDGYSASEFCKILDAANHKEASHFERFLFAEPELGQRINLHSMTLALPEMGKPRSERTADAFLPANGIHPINADGVSSSAINDAVKRSLYPVRLWSTKAQNVADEYDRSVALLRLIEAVIAVHRFQYRHGTFPATLQDLVPEFLEEVPVDPFSMTGEVLRYRLFDGGCAVYTVSWNSRDDGGWSVLFPYWYNSVDMDDDGFCIGSVSCESPSDF